ncbi:MAG: hypothetical protein V4449_00795 [Patescibacteria group bacterium]
MSAEVVDLESVRRSTLWRKARPLVGSNIILTLKCWRDKPNKPVTRFRLLGTGISASGRPSLFVRAGRVTTSIAIGFDEIDRIDFESWEKDVS